MRNDRPLWALIITALATYPALGLSWCAVALLATYPDIPDLGLVGYIGSLAAIALVATGAVAVAKALWAAGLGLWRVRKFNVWAAAWAVPVTAPVSGIADEVGLRGRIRLVATDEQFAVTTGLLRPSVSLSTSLAVGLEHSELRAVLAHEQAHVRRRDPLRVLLGQMLAAHLWFLPAARDMRARARRGYELAADRDAVARYGRPALASALLRVTSSPVATPAFAPQFADSDLLDARVAQLESGDAPDPAPIPPRRSASTAVGALAFVATVAGAWALMWLACPHAMIQHG